MDKKFEAVKTVDDIMDQVISIYNEDKSSLDASKILKISKKCNQAIRKNNISIIAICDKLFELESFYYFSIATYLIKDNECYKNKENFMKFICWAEMSINTWGKCDQYCYRVLNPTLEEFPELFEKVLLWQKSENVYLKRAIPVSLIHSSTSFSVHLPFSFVEEAVFLLCKEEHIHIQKGIGWLLKYAYLTYPEETMNLLITNYKILPCTVISYAMEKMDDEDKQRIKCLKNKK